MILKCIRTVAMAALAMVSINVSGQDLLARQAPDFPDFTAANARVR
jgi:hypothetical protein